MVGVPSLGPSLPLSPPPCLLPLEGDRLARSWLALLWDRSILPLLEEKEWEELNRILAENGVHLIAKLHPLQDIGEFTHCEMSNLSVYSGKYFGEQGGNLYSLLAQSDALISDYSSVYLEYLVLNRPICFTVGDMTEYSGKRGFVFDNPLEFMPGDQLHCKEELYQFIRDIAQGVDNHKVERERVNSLVNHYKDANNCQRILAISGIRKV